MKWLKGWLGIGKDQTTGKKTSVFAPLLGKQDPAKTNALHGGGMDANVVPNTGLEWMDEKNQK